MTGGRAMFATLADALDALRPATWDVQVQIATHEMLMSGALQRGLPDWCDLLVRLSADAATDDHDAELFAVQLVHETTGIMPIGSQVISWPDIRG